MARDQTLLSSSNPIAIAPANPHIAHVQLRDLLICPREQGLVNYISDRRIVEQDLHAPGAPSRVVALLDFQANSLTSLHFEQENATLFAAGGQEAELHLSYHKPSSSSRSSSSSSNRTRTPRTRLIWQTETQLPGSINNSVLLTSLSLTGSHESSVEPRVGISNNDGSVRLYDIPMRVQSSRRNLVEVGVVKLDVPVNHSSISPDGRTLLSVGDSNKVYFHRISGSTGARLTFTPITTLLIPPPDVSSSFTSTSSPTSSSLVASFSTAFSRDGSKFAVASQEGVVAVWDVRSTKPLKVFYTDKSRTRSLSSPLSNNGAASGWLSDDPWEWTRGTRAPGWCVRSVKFNNSSGGGNGGKLGRREGGGKEVMAFTEHTSVVHVVDAVTFETREVVRVPSLNTGRGKHRSGRVRRDVVGSERRRVRQSSSAPPPSTSTTPPSGASSIRRRQVGSDIISDHRRVVAPVPSTSTMTTTTVGENPTSTSRSGSNNASSPTLNRSGSTAPGIAGRRRTSSSTSSSPYSAPPSIGDSTWRTVTLASLREDEDERNRNGDGGGGGGGGEPSSSSSGRAAERQRGAGIGTGVMRRGAEARRGMMMNSVEFTFGGPGTSVRTTTSASPTPPSPPPLPTIPMMPPMTTTTTTTTPTPTRTTSTQMLMPSLHALADYVLEEPGINNTTMAGVDEMQEEREGEMRIMRQLRMMDFANRRRRRRRERERGRGFGSGEMGDSDDDDDGGIVPLPIPPVGSGRGGSFVAADVVGIGGPVVRERREGGGLGRDVGEDLDLDLDEYVTTESELEDRDTHGEFDYMLYGRRRAEGRRATLEMFEGIPEMDVEEAEDVGVEEEEEEEDNRMDVDVPEEEDEEEEREEDEEEGDTDCASDGVVQHQHHHHHSRSVSPTTLGSPTAGAVHPATLSRVGRRNEEEYYDESGAYYSGRPQSRSSSSPSTQRKTPKLTFYDDIDIAGICFDPWGERMYVAASGMNVGPSGVGFVGPGGGGGGGGPTTGAGGSGGLFAGAFGSPSGSGVAGGSAAAAAGGGNANFFGTVVEWGVRGAEKKFWVDEGWM